MKRIRIVAADDSPFIRARDRTDRDRSRPGGATQAEIDATLYRSHHPGSATSPQLFEIRIEPNCEVQRHAHSEDEIIAVIEGEIHVGSTVLRAGSSLAIDAYTLYGFRTGPDGVRFLNFRPRADSVYLDAAAFMARRRERSESETDDDEVVGAD
jgi:quercetin dioxygenase-like cupin family protein